jgi:hypothetical protein
MDGYQRTPNALVYRLLLTLIGLCSHFSYAETIWEIKASAGLVSHSVSENSVRTGMEEAAGITFDSLTLNESSSNYSLALLFRLEDQVFIESGYQNLGDVDVVIAANIADPAVLEAGLLEFGPAGGKGYYLGGGYEHQIGQKLWVSVYGGLFDWSATAKAKASSLASSVNTKLSGTDPYYGFGIVYKWYMDSAVYFDIKKYKLNQNSPVTASVGFSIRF